MFADFVPDQDAICVERLKAAGAIVLGKTNTPEFGWVAVTQNRLFGPTRNPWNPGRTSGGSSGGAASGVAAGLGPLAIGSDGGGSIRIPSSFCGVFGHKPSHGRVPAWPGFPDIWEGLSVVGPITRTVRDAALMMEVIAGRDDRDYFSLPDEGLSYLPLLEKGIEGLRVAWSPDLGYATVDPEVLRLTEAAARALGELGCRLEEASPEAHNPQESSSTVVGASVATFPGGQMAGWEDEVDAGLARFVERGRNILATDYLRARLANIDYRNQVQAFFDEYDLLLTPTLAVPPFEVGSFGPREIAGKRVAPIDWMAFTFPFNITGQPAASVPCGFTSDGLPVGLQIVGRRFDDGTVLRAAAAFERARPWADRFPPLD
jgi:aspartyl-tRNA(Asn)/glutamyl-tRNA(Gln) amidotransferase subunit A